MMTPERWQQVKGLLQEALNLAPEQRPAFLDRACSTDHSLRREVESLLSSSNEACFAEPCVITRDERSLSQLNAVVMRVRVSDNLARILPCC